MKIMYIQRNYVKHTRRARRLSKKEQEEQEVEKQLQYFRCSSHIESADKDRKNTKPNAAFHCNPCKTS